MKQYSLRVLERNSPWTWIYNQVKQLNSLIDNSIQNNNNGTTDDDTKGDLA